MSSAQAPRLIGVDAGGTKTRVALAELSGGQIHLLATASSGPGNVRSDGFQAATANIQQAIEQANAASELSHHVADAACFCVAGAGRPEEKAAVETWALESNIARRVRVVSDADVLFSGAADQLGHAVDAGICVIAGTGSIAIGKNARGETARCGGWGYILGDRGSGYAIGRDALTAIADQADELGPATSLTQVILDHLQLNSPQELIGWCYADPQPRRRIASLAPCVFTSEADLIASEIIARAARDLAKQAAGVCRKLELSAPILACSGSLLVQQPTFLASVIDNLSKLGIDKVTTCTIPHPEQAALQIARSLLS